MKVTSQSVNHPSRHEEDEKFDFKQLILKYVRSWPFFVASILLAVATAHIVNQHKPPVYKIQGKFLVKDESSGIDIFEYAGGDGKYTLAQKAQKIANESIIIKSRTIAEHALEELDFDVEYYNEGFFTDSEIYRKTPISVEVDWDHAQLTNGRIRISWENHESFQFELLDKEYSHFIPGEKNTEVIEITESYHARFPFGKWIEYPFGKLLINFYGAGKSGSLVIRIRDRESLIQQYTGENLQVTPADKTSSVLLLALDTQQPHKGRDYLNTLMKVFLDNELEEKNTIARNTVSFIDNQLAGITDSLTYTQNKLESFRSRNQTYNITTEGNTLFEKLSELEKTLAQENFRLEYYLSLQKYLQGEHYSEIMIPSGLGIEDPVLNKLIEELIRFQAEKSRFLATQTENSPAVIEVNHKIRDLNTSIQEALKNVIRNAHLLIGDLNKRIGKIQAQFGRLPQTEQNLLNIKRSYSLNENIYTFLLQRRAEASITLASNMPTNKIIEPAVLNLVPMRLRPMLNYFLAFMLGLIFPIATISLREMFSVKINDLKEVEEKLQIPIAACIGHNHNFPPLVVLNHPRARISEAFRALRANIDFIFPSDKQVTILVTSTVAGEGKSFCSVNLASVYSACGKKTIIVACDMHKTFSPNGLNVSNTVGLSNFLDGQTSQLKDIIQKTDYMNLDVLAPGPIPANPAELLISERFRNLLRDLKLFYDVIVLDSSPLGLTNETLYLTRMTDLTLFVLRQNYSEKSFLDDINSFKEKKGIENVFAVINGVENKYLSHRGYGYGYYEDDKRQNRFKRVLKLISSKAAI